MLDGSTASNSIAAPMPMNILIGIVNDENLSSLNFLHINSSMTVAIIETISTLIDIKPALLPSDDVPAMALEINAEIMPINAAAEIASPSFFDFSFLLTALPIFF